MITLLVINFIVSIFTLFLIILTKVENKLIEHKYAEMLKNAEKYRDHLKKENTDLSIKLKK